MDEVSVVIVEDHSLTRIGLRVALQTDKRIKVINEAVDAVQGLKLLETLRPNVAIVDIGLPNIDGIELTQRFREYQQQAEDYETKIMILTMINSEETVLAAFAAGADSYCLKDSDTEVLQEAVKQTYQGNSWIDPRIASLVLHRVRHKVRQEPSNDAKFHGKKTVAIDAIAPDCELMMKTLPLTERELTILEMIVAGDSNAAIAEKLYITVGTVKTHIRNILNKLCVDDRTQAAVRALRSGLVS
jgi:DNA-binding NarL/FixJ family response regulator